MKIFQAHAVSRILSSEERTSLLTEEMLSCAIYFLCFASISIVLPISWGLVATLEAFATLIISHFPESQILGHIPISFCLPSAFYSQICFNGLELSV